MSGMACAEVMRAFGGGAQTLLLSQMQHRLYREAAGATYLC